MHGLSLSCRQPLLLFVSIAWDLWRKEDQKPSMTKPLFIHYLTAN